tara:strand:+ start:86 stop:709 length:624 start_codon:yes stop_codon:yes gene_type:complete
MKILISITLTLLLALPVSAQTFTLGVDLSGSNPLLRHGNFAHVASQYVSQEIHRLKDGDVVVIKTFGATANARNVLSNRYVITRKLKASKIAAIVARYLQSLPAQTDASQNQTNLIAFMEFTSFGCREGRAQVLLITDGLEYSELVDGNKLLNGKQGLPPAEVELTGCDVTFYGLGAGFSPTSIRFLRNEWRNWFKPTGANFVAVIP